MPELYNRQRPYQQQGIFTSKRAACTVAVSRTARTPTTVQRGRDVHINRIVAGDIYPDSSVKDSTYINSSTEGAQHAYNSHYNGHHLP